MDILHINGATRVIGEAQGYLGLPLRDELVNDAVNGPGTPSMVTAWQPTADELDAISAGAPIYLRVLGTSHPPVLLFAGPRPARISGKAGNGNAVDEPKDDEVDEALVMAPTYITVAAGDVLDERTRQIEQEGWTPDHDDAQDDGEMGRAAACYALQAGEVIGQRPLEAWPWEDKWWKPSARRRDLVKAGALILAEIERLDRAAERERRAEGGAS